jgi:hypothetical protein
MDGKSGWERLFRWARPRAHPQVVDAADVGTAYGMELTIDASQRAEDQAKARDEAARIRTEPPPLRR